jgi:hypothetical protein
VDFQIVIPQVLYLGLGRSSALRNSAPSVAVYSNGRSVTLVATQSVESTAPPGVAAHASNVILNATTRRVIATRTACAPPALAAGAHHYFCTIAAP